MMNFIQIDMNDPRVGQYLCQHGVTEDTHAAIHNVEVWRDPRGNLVMLNINGVVGIPDTHMKAFANA